MFYFNLSSKDEACFSFADNSLLHWIPSYSYYVRYSLYQHPADSSIFNVIVPQKKTCKAVIISLLRAQIRYCYKHVHLFRKIMRGIYCENYGDFVARYGADLRSYYADLNPKSTELNNLNFHPLEVVSRYRDPQLQVGENYSHLLDCLTLILLS